jgi:microsomal epoxide hydrolase
MFAGGPPGRDDDFDDVTETEQRLMDRGAWYMAEDNGYFRIQETRPQTLGTALNDSPAGLLSWIGEKFHGWVDHDGDPLDVVDRDQVLANVSTYWFTGTINSSTRMYFETMKAMARGEGLAENAEVPLGVSAFPAELFMSRRRWVEATHNVTFWREYDRGGHFATMERPEAIVADIREFFRELR